MGLYSFGRSNVPMVVGTDLMTFLCGTARKARIVEVSAHLLGIVTEAGEIVVARSSGGVGGGGGLTLVAFEPDEGGLGSQVLTTWGTPPTLGNVLLRIPLNPDGEHYLWQAPPTGGFDEDGGDITNRSQQQFSFRPTVGDANVSIHVVFEEP